MPGDEEPPATVVHEKQRSALVKLIDNTVIPLLMVVLVTASTYILDKYPIITEITGLNEELVRFTVTGIVVFLASWIKGRLSEYHRE